MMRAHNFLDLTGHKFGLLTVQEFAGIRLVGKAQKKFSTWRCVCDCGNAGVWKTNHLRTGHAKSCGCKTSEMVADAKLVHGENRRGYRVTAEYRAWAAMKTRCTNPRQRHWKHYGGRGISYCDRWESFENFLSDMGRKPSPSHSLDRYPNNDGNYEPSNCRWATPREQMANQRPRTSEERSVAAKIGKARALGRARV